MGSVWYREVDIALSSKLKEIFGKDVPIYFMVQRDKRKEKDIKYPHIQIHKLDSIFDHARYDSTPKLVYLDTVNSEATYKEASKPYNLLYQINLVCDKQNDLNNLSMKWASRHTTFQHLKVIDNTNEEQLCYVSSMPPISLYEEGEDDKLILMYAIRLNIRVRLDEGMESTVKIASEIDVKYK